MQNDEQAIRDLAKTWLIVSKVGDLDAALRLMTDDGAFLVRVKEPSGNAAFAVSIKAIEHHLGWVSPVVVTGRGQGIG